MDEQLDRTLYKMVQPERKWYIEWDPTPLDPYAVLVHHFAPSEEIASYLTKVPGVLAARPVRIFNSVINKDVPCGYLGFYLTVQKQLYSPEAIKAGIDHVLHNWERRQEQVNKMIGWDSEEHDIRFADSEDADQIG